MKILFCLLFAPLFSIAQKALKIPKHSNVIYLSGITRWQMKDSLIKRGFTVVDHDSLSFVTLPRPYKVLEHGNLVIQCSFKDTLGKMTGIYNLIANDLLLAPYGNKWRRAEKTVLESLEREAFEIINGIAEKMPATLAYAKEKSLPIEVQ